MSLSDVINDKWLNSDVLKTAYCSAEPFSHIVMHVFIRKDVLKGVADEFPDLSKLGDLAVKFDQSRHIKFASKGMGALSPRAVQLNSLHHANKLTILNSILNE